MKPLDMLISQIEKRENKVPFLKRFFIDINAGYEEIMHYNYIDMFSRRLLLWHFIIFSLYTTVIFYSRLSERLMSPFSWRLISQAEAFFTIGIAFLITLFPYLIQKKTKNHYVWRLIFATSLTVYSYLFVFISGGSIEMHFHFFIVLAYLVIYADWRLGWWVLLLTVLHHSLLDIMRPEWVFHYGTNILAPASHAIPVLITVILTTKICNSHRNALVAQRELERQKDEFVSTASHELKTPITSQKMFIQVLKKEILQYNNEKANKYIDKISDQVTKLSKLITDLLDVSRMQLGKLTFEKEPFDIKKLIEETVEILQVTTKKHVLRIVGTSDYKVIGDRNRIYQVMINLLSNAIKYSPRGGRVTITILPTTSKVVVSVEDQGIGIAKEEQKNIFNRLYRAIGDDETTFPGLGIGLYISAEIIKHHGGRIWVESQKGKGSTFYFSLPLSIIKV